MSQQKTIVHLPEVVNYTGLMENLHQGAVVEFTHPRDESLQKVRLISGMVDPENPAVFVFIAVDVETKEAVDVFYDLEFNTGAIRKAELDWPKKGTPAPPA